MSDIKFLREVKYDHKDGKCRFMKETIGDRYRFVLRFHNGVVFYSNKRRYSHSDLRKIATGQYVIQGGLTESYAVTPEEAERLRNRTPEQVYADNLRDWIARNKKKEKS